MEISIYKVSITLLFPFPKWGTDWKNLGKKSSLSKRRLEEAGAGVTEERVAKGNIALLVQKKIWMGKVNSPRSSTSTPAQSLSICLKNGNTDDNVGTCKWKGIRHGNSTWKIVNGMEVSSWRAASHSLKQIFAFRFLDGFNKNMTHTW